MEKYLKLKEQLKLNKNDEEAKSMAQYMRNRFAFYGISSSIRKEIFKEIIKEEKKNKKIDWDFLDECYRDEHREMQYFVCAYLASMNNFLIYEDISKIKEYLKIKQWWDTTDSFDKIIGNIGLKDNRVDDLMIEWSKDKDIWLRRIAIDHQLARKEKVNHELLETIIINNLDNKEFFINKAIGWSLRSYSKINPEWVKRFVEKYKNKMSGLSIKEAMRDFK